MLSDFWMFLKLVFLGGSTVLTPQLITIDKNNPFIYQDELKVVNSGAHLRIEISESSKHLQFVQNIELTDHKSRDRFNEQIKDFNIIVTAEDLNNHIITFKKITLFWGKNTGINISSAELQNVKGIRKLKVERDKSLDNIKITWINFRK